MMITVIRSAELPQRLPDERLGADVERARRLVEDQHVGRLDERASDDQPLLLSAAEVAALLADLVVVAVRESLDVVVEVRQSGGSFDLPRR